MASIVDRTLVISADIHATGSSGGVVVLDEQSLLCTAEREALGRVDEVFGPVTSPRYTVRREIWQVFPEGVAPGTKVFYVEPEVKFVVASGLHKKVCAPIYIYIERERERGASECMTRLAIVAVGWQQGYDASGKDDEELPEELQEFSDDEEEKRFKKGGSPASAATAGYDGGGDAAAAAAGSYLKRGSARRMTMKNKGRGQRG